MDNSNSYAQWTLLRDSQRNNRCNCPPYWNAPYPPCPQPCPGPYPPPCPGPCPPPGPCPCPPPGPGPCPPPGPCPCPPPGPTCCPGPTGPAGTGTTAALSGFQVQLQGSSSGIVDNGADVLFDTVLNSSSPNVTYNPAAGTFTITRPGNYYISWWVSTDGAQAQTNIVFGIRTLSGSIVSPILSSSPSPMVTLQLNGSALLTVSAVPTVFSLYNNSGAPVNYGQEPVQAGLTMVEVS